MSAESDFQNVIENVIAQREEKQKTLECMPFEYKEFSKGELIKLIELRKLITGALSKIPVLPPSELDKTFASLLELQKTIDECPIWNAKFSTGDEERVRRADSIYYTTPSGISLRFKMWNVGNDLSRVVQPFMESITYLSGTQYFPKQTPQLGSTPIEYCSDEFLKLQKQEQVDGNFTSQVKRYFKDGELYYVEPPPNLYHEHPGNPVNKIYWIK